MRNVTVISKSSFISGLVDVAKEVANGQTVIIQSDGNWAIPISPEDYNLFQRLVREEEDRIDTSAAKRAMKDVKKNGTISWESIKQQLGL